MIRTFIALAALSAIVFAGEARADDRSNVLLISVDDLNDWVGCLGGHPQAKTPNIDRLAKRGTLFRNAHCQAPVCTPSRASMMTGRLPSTTGMYFLQPHIHQVESADEIVTLVPRFAQAGYKTMAAGKIYGGHENRHFETYGGGMGGFGPRPQEKISFPIGHPLWDWGAYPDTNEQMPDWKVADWAIDQLGKQHEQPFFLGVGFWRPHVPMYAPQQWFDMHPLRSVKLPETVEGDRDDLPTYAKNLTIGHPAPRQEWFEENEGEWEHAVQSYLASCTFADHCVGRVLDALDSSPHAKNTVVALFSDHGWHLGEKRRWAKRSLWEDSTRVPLIVAAPGMPAGGECDAPTGLIDVYPTLLELCGLPADQNLEGRSLKPLLADADAAWKRPVITTFGPHNHAVRSRQWRYIHYSDGSEELYNHAEDPHEWRNLAGDDHYASVIAEHRRHLPQVNAPHLDKPNSSGLEAYRAAEKAREE